MAKIQVDKIPAYTDGYRIQAEDYNEPVALLIVQGNDHDDKISALEGAQSKFVDESLQNNDNLTPSSKQVKEYVDGMASAVQDDLTSHAGNSDNPHGVTKAQLGLDEVNNTSDVNKPVSTATQSALDALKGTGHTNQTIKGNADAIAAVVATGGGIPDAPNDGSLYARLSQGWAVINLHSHANQALLDAITNSGDGSKYLADDGTYKTVVGGGGGGTWGSITGTLADQTDLNSALAGKADAHSHPYASDSHDHSGTYEPADGDIVKAPGGVLPALDGSNLTGIAGGGGGVDLTTNQDIDGEKTFLDDTFFEKDALIKDQLKLAIANGVLYRTAMEYLTGDVLGIGYSPKLYDMRLFAKDKVEVEYSGSSTKYELLTSKDLNPAHVKTPYVANVLDYGAVGDNINDDTVYIQAAFDIAKSVPGLTVVIPEGTYRLTDTLRIYKNTTLQMGEGTILMRDAEYNPMMTNGDATDTWDGYEGNSNIRITGGVFDINGLTHIYASNGISFGHASNIIIENTKFYNCVDWHHIEFNAIKDGRIVNCTFDGHTEISPGTRDFTEMVQFDFAGGSDQFGAFGNYDDTVCDNILVQGCTFRNGFRGVGSHTFKAGVMMQSIQVVNNVFEDFSSYGIRLSVTNHGMVSNNILRRTKGLCVSACTNSIISNNDVVDHSDSGILITYTAESPQFGTANIFSAHNKISNNRITYEDWNPADQVDARGIYVKNGSHNIIDSNHVEDTWDNGIQVGVTASLSAVGNVIKNNVVINPNVDGGDTGTTAGIAVYSTGNQKTRVNNNLVISGGSSGIDHGIYASGSTSGCIMTHNTTIGPFNTSGYTNSSPGGWVYSNAATG